MLWYMSLISLYENKMACENKENCHFFVPNKNVWEEPLVELHNTYINCKSASFSLVINWLLILILVTLLKISFFIYKTTPSKCFFPADFFSISVSLLILLMFIYASFRLSDMKVLSPFLLLAMRPLSILQIILELSNWLTGFGSTLDGVLSNRLLSG